MDRDDPLPSDLPLRARPVVAPGVSRAQLAASLVAAACRRAPYDASQFARPDRSPVALYAARDYDVDFEDADRARPRPTSAIDVRGRRVLSQAEHGGVPERTAINTDPHGRRRRRGGVPRAPGAASVMVGEGPGHRRDTEYLLTQTGLYDHLKEERLRFVDLNQDDVREVRLRSRFTGLETLALPVELLPSDFIVSMPKLKTHHWAGMTASMKNFFGTVPGAVYGWPKNILHVHGIEASILDLNATIRPHLAILDAVTAMEGDGPIMGVPRHVGFVGMSRDLVALDGTAARMIGLDPGKLPYLAAAGDFLGNLDVRRIEQRGEAVARFATTFEVVDAFKGARLSQS